MQSSAGRAASGLASLALSLCILSFARASEDTPPSPQASGLAASLKAQLVKNARSFVGKRATVRIGAESTARYRVDAIDERGVRAAGGGVEVNASWERLGEEGIYRLALSLSRGTPTAFRGKCLLLGVVLGHWDEPSFEKALTDLGAQDREAVVRVEAALRAARDARRAEAEAKAEAREDAPAAKRRKSPYDEVATTPSKPLRLRGIRGRTVSALRIAPGPDEDGPAVEISDCEDLTVEYCEIGPCKRAFSVSGSRNVRILNCFVHDTAHQPGVAAYRCDGLLVQGNRIERVSSGVYALESTGVKVVGNYVENCQGPMPRGQLAQFDKCRGEGNEVSRNYGVNFRGESRPEDMVNIYKSTGTADSPIMIEGNFLVGDPHWGSEDMSGSGSGCMLGDGDGRYITCRGNTLISPGQVGIGVCGGSDILVEGNVILGTQSNVANVGLYVWDISKSEGSNIAVRRNLIAWKSKTGGDNHFWKADPTGFTNVTIADNDFGNWQHFRRSFPRPPSPAPMPPVPAGVEEGRPPAFPWNAEDAIAGKAEKMAKGLRNFP